MPLGLFIVGLFNLILAKLKKNKDIIKKTFKNFIFNIVIGIIVFFMVLLINVGLDYYQDSQDDGNFRDCWHEGTVDINTNN